MLKAVVYCANVTCSTCEPSKILAAQTNYGQYGITLAAKLRLNSLADEDYRSQNMVGPWLTSSTIIRHIITTYQPACQLTTYLGCFLRLPDPPPLSVAPTLFGCCLQMQHAHTRPGRGMGESHAACCMSIAAATQLTRSRGSSEGV
jgi:hypothetical protein